MIELNTKSEVNMKEVISIVSFLFLIGIFIALASSLSTKTEVEESSQFFKGVCIKKVVSIHNQSTLIPDLAEQHIVGDKTIFILKSGKVLTFETNKIQSVLGICKTL